MFDTVDEISLKLAAPLTVELDDLTYEDVEPGDPDDVPEEVPEEVPNEKFDDESEDAPEGELEDVLDDDKLDDGPSDEVDVELETEPDDEVIEEPDDVWTDEEPDATTDISSEVEVSDMLPELALFWEFLVGEELRDEFAGGLAERSLASGIIVESITGVIVLI